MAGNLLYIDRTRPVWLVTKAGGFGDGNALAEIGRRLRARAPAAAT